MHIKEKMSKPLLAAFVHNSFTSQFVLNLCQLQKNRKSASAKNITWHCKECKLKLKFRLPLGLMMPSLQPSKLLLAANSSAKRLNNFIRSIQNPCAKIITIIMIKITNQLCPIACCFRQITFCANTQFTDTPVVLRTSAQFG